MVEPARPIGLLPLFLPPIAWWAAARNRTVVLDTQSRYLPQSELHRCTIKAAGGPLLLVVPVIRGSKYTSIGEAQIDNRRDWSRPLRQSIRSAYGRAPYYLYFNDLIERIVAINRLVELNLSLIRWLYAAIGWPEAQLVDSGTHEDCRFVGVRGAHLPGFQSPEYWQSFGSFEANLSIVDALFQLGPELDTYLNRCQPKSRDQGLQVSK